MNLLMIIKKLSNALEATSELFEINLPDTTKQK
jgi:hypothetical protein